MPGVFHASSAADGRFRREHEPELFPVGCGLIRDAHEIMTPCSRQELVFTSGPDGSLLALYTSMLSAPDRKLTMTRMPSLTCLPVTSTTASQGLFGPDRRDQGRRDGLVARVRAEFAEMPCLRLTEPQSQRLLGLRGGVCRRVLTTLLEERFLWKGSDGRYGLAARHWN